MAADPCAPAVRVRGLTKRYGDRAALLDVGLELAPGELHGLLGPNGAGKTTLLRMLFGLVHPDGGSVALLGRELTAGAPRPVAGVAGFVEDPAFYPYLSGRVNLELLAELDDDDGGGGGGEEIDATLDRVGLGARAGDRVAGYSTGMRQRLGIAAALIRRPRLLLLDEPTSGLDPAGIAAVGALLRELAAGGTAVIVSSHLIGELEGLCHSYTIMRAGRVVWQGDAGQLAASAPGSTYALSTSDDRRALALATARTDVRIASETPGAPITVVADAAGMDTFVLELARHGVAVRRLERRTSPLETVFFSLTGEA